MSKSFQIKRKAGYQRQGSDLRMASLTPSRSKIVDGTQVHSDDAIEKKFWSKFLMDKVLGKGGYGVVILIRDKTQGRPVALKLIEKNKTSEEVYSKLKHEPKILSKFAKSNYIVQMLDSFESQKRMFILMEYMEGGDLSQYIKKRQSEGYQFRETEIAVIITGLFKALKSIHGKKVIHGDIKPGMLS